MLASHRSIGRAHPMTRLIRLLLPFFFIALSAGCRQTPSETVQLPQGTYTGTLPCSDCSGIQIAVTFDPEGTVAQSTLYEGTGKPFTTESGTWKMNEKGKITARFPAGNRFFQAGRDSIDVLDPAGKPYPEHTNQYTLQKMRVKNAVFFAGDWIQGSEDGTGYRQILKIRGETVSDVVVSIDFSGAPKGCRFHAKGTVTQGQIDIPLQNVEPDMKGVLVIRPGTKADTLNVFTLNPDDRNELMYFCGGGASLAGDYRKEVR